MVDSSSIVGRGGGADLRQRVLDQVEKLTQLGLRQSTAVGRHDQFDAIGDGEVTAHLHRAGPRRRQRHVAACLEQVADGLQRQPRFLPVADAQQVRRVRLRVVRAALRTLVPMKKPTRKPARTPSTPIPAADLEKARGGTWTFTNGGVTHEDDWSANT